jgi:hypothetical protein
MNNALRSVFIATVVLLVGTQPALGQDAALAEPPSGGPLIRVLFSQPVHLAESIPASTQAAATAHDEELIARALTRPQPTESPVRQLEHGGDVVHGPGMIRPWEQSVSTWGSPAFCHRPLYFEDENLERHGRSFGLAQPAVSAAHFAGRGLVWPYLAGAFPPHECIYSLGRERPGSCAAYRLYRPPVSARGAAYQAAAVTGLSFVVP